MFEYLTFEIQLLYFTVLTDQRRKSIWFSQWMQEKHLPEHQFLIVKAYADAAISLLGVT